MIAYPEIDPVALALGPVKIHWYGLAYLGGIAIAWWLASIYCRRPWSPIKRDQLDDLVFYVALGVILGGRVGYILFYGLGKVADDPAWLLRVWEGGMSFHGGFLGVLLSVYIFGRQNNIQFGRLMDFVAPLVPVGLGLGRLGNFINQGLWGRGTDVPWGMVFPNDPLGLTRHPSQLYQFALEGVLLLTVLLIYSRRERPVWSVAALFSIIYGSVRFFAEFFREPDRHLGFQAFDWMTRGQMLSVPMIVAGILLMWVAHKGLLDNKQAVIGKHK